MVIVPRTAGPATLRGRTIRRLRHLALAGTTLLRALGGTALLRAFAGSTRLALAGTTLVGALGVAGAPAGDGGWQPVHLQPASATVADVCAAVARERGSGPANSTAHLTLSARGRSYPVTLDVSGSDLRFSTIVDGATWQAGTAGAHHWRRTPAGTVHDTRSDLQGDPIDRWPISLVPLDCADLIVAGEIRNPQPEWILEHGSRSGRTQWIFVDEASGAIVREVAREGSAVYTTVFGDEREVLGARRPMGWRTTGFGGDASVTLDDVVAANASNPIGPPASLALAGVPEHGGTVVLPTRFDRNRITLVVAVNGRPENFDLDGGTVQLTLTADAARRAGIADDLGHGIATSLDAGDVHLSRVPFLTVPSIFGQDGLLGYDFFLGWIVHIDYAAHRVELIPRADFTPPSMARLIPMSFAEGLPLVNAMLGNVIGHRFALDIGSSDLVVTHAFWAQQPPGTPEPDEPGLRPLRSTFLEGTVVVRAAALPALTFEGITFSKVYGDIIQDGYGDTIDLPFDAIAGTEVLDHFDWWFDASGNRAWITDAPH